jgi:hypothetical protein
MLNGAKQHAFAGARWANRARRFRSRGYLLSFREIAE